MVNILKNYLFLYNIIVIKDNGGLGNQLITLMSELYINKWENCEVLFKFKNSFILSKIL